MGFAAALGAIVTIGGTAIQVASQRRAASYNASLADYQSRLAASQAQSAQNAAREAAKESALALSNQRREDARFRGAQRAAYARSGVAEAGSVLEVLGETAANQSRARLELQREGAYRAREYASLSTDLQAQSQLSRYQASYERQEKDLTTAGLIVNAGTSLLSQAGQQRRRTTSLNRAGLY